MLNTHDWQTLTPNLQAELTTHAGFYDGNTYLVTGGAGFIGSHLVRHLLHMGAFVVVVDDFNPYYDPAVKRANVAEHAHNPKFTLVEADICDVVAMRRVFDAHGAALKQGGIVHLAAWAGVRPSLDNPSLYMQANVTGTHVLAELCREFGVSRFTFASSSSVYGSVDASIPGSVPFLETQDTTKPVSIYAATKVMNENMLHSYSHLFGLQVVCLRFFTVYGAGQRPDLAIHKFTDLIAKGQPVPQFGDGSTERDYTYIDDIQQGILAAMRYDATPFEVINLGESHTVTLSKLIQLLEDALGQKAIIDYQPLQQGDVPITYANVDKAKKLLGYMPTTLIEDGIPKFVRWYQDTRGLSSASSVNS
ncbi:MAG: GDP-mannose 4,6-dehydratase [Vampirovibrionales bacterium]|nr:GDP-mannose 4,6-dehydratase [Vampirovibrionales bacterium]